MTYRNWEAYSSTPWYCGDCEGVKFCATPGGIKALIRHGQGVPARVCKQTIELFMMWTIKPDGKSHGN